MVRSTGLRKVNIAVFISGTGSNLFNLIKYSKLKNSKYTVKHIFSDKKNILCLNGDIYNFKEIKKGSADLI